MRKISKLKKINLLVTIVMLSVTSSSQALDLDKMLKRLKEKSQQSQTASPQNNTGNLPSKSSQGVGNSYQSQNDPRRESVKKQRAIVFAKASGSPVEVKETADGKERVSKADVLTEALTKAVSSVHPDLGLPLAPFYNTYSELQKNITNSAYGLINKFDKTEKENIYMMLGQPDPQKNTWSVTVDANINTKLTEENYRKIKEDSRVIYTQSIGSNPQQARDAAILNAVQQYHQINLAPNSPVITNMLNSNYGLIQKVDVISEAPDPYTKLIISKIKVTLADMSSVDKSKFDRIKNDMEVSRVKEPPNPVLESLRSATREVGAAQSIIERALDIKVVSELSRQDAYRARAGTRFGSNDFEWEVGMTAERWATIEERMKVNPKLDEEQRKEYQRGQKAMIPAYASVIKASGSIFTSLSSSGNPFQSLQAMIQFPKLMAANSEGMNAMMSYNTNNGIDNTELEDTKKQMGD